MTLTASTDYKIQVIFDIRGSLRFVKNLFFVYLINNNKSYGKYWFFKRRFHK